MTRPVRTTEERRLRRRRWRLWATLPVWLAVFLLGAHLGLVNVVGAVALGQYHRGEVGAASVGFGYLRATDVVETWKAPYDLGTNLTLGGDARLAVFYLGDALGVAPEDPETRCMILINLSIALEQLGDSELADAEVRAGWAEEAQGYVDRGEPYPAYSPWGDATPEQIREEGRELAAWAVADYEEAERSRQECPPEGQSSQEQQENAESQDRLEDKRQEAQDRADPPPEPEEGGGQQSEEEQRQQELAQRNAEAEAQAELERQQEQGGQGGFETKNW